MSDKDPAENWQLQNSGKTEDQWQLREAEQSVLDQLQLQPAAGASPDWQPVEYVRPASSSRRWILPSIVTVLLLALVGYMLWVGLGSLIPPLITLLPSAGTPAALPPGEEATPTAEVMAVVPPETAEPTPTPTPSVEPPTPAPTEEPPTPTATVPAVVEQRFAVVNSPYGVNVRAQPATDAPLVTLLENGRQVWALAGQGDWVEVLISEGELSLSTPISATTGWATAEFLTLTTGTVDRALYAAVMQAIGRETAAVQDEVPSAPPPLAGEPVTVSLTVTSPAGLNIREQPSVASPPIRLLENGATVPVVAVSDDGLWYQVRLDDGVLGWGFGEFVTITGDLASLSQPAPEAAPTVEAAPSAEAAPAVQAAPAVTTTAPALPAAPPLEGVVATVTRLLPVYATPDASQPRISLVMSDAALQVVGRSADSAYLQVLLPTGGAAWAPVSGVELNVGVETLPVIDGG